MNANITHWVLVANSGHARILERRSGPYEFRQVANLVSEAQHLTNRELVSDASGRVYHAQGPGTHAMEPRSDPHENAEALFCKDLVRKMEEAARQGRFDRLLMIADPKTLGRLRAQLNRELAGKVAREVPLDLVNLPLPRLEERVSDLLERAA
jgi:protein required for attachment to host cells